MILDSKRLSKPTSVHSDDSLESFTNLIERANLLDEDNFLKDPSILTPYQVNI